MKRIAAIMAAIVTLAAGFFLLLSSLVSVDAARERATHLLAAWTGQQVAADETAELRLFPAPRLILYNLRVGATRGDSQADILIAKELQADIRVLPLLIGRISFSALTLNSSEINLLRDANGARNWKFDDAAAAVQIALSGDLPFGRIVLNETTVTYENVRRQERETVTLPELALDWESIRQPAAVSGSITMRDETIAFEARIASPLAYLERKSTDFSATLSGDFVNAQLDGQLADYKAVRFAGRLEAGGTSLRRIIRFLGGPDSTGPGLGAITISGRADIEPDKLFIDQGQVQLDDNVATGSLGISLTDKPKLSGTLAFQNLDLTPYLADFGHTESLDWSKRQFETNWFDNLDADIRLSANRIIAGPYTLGSTAASALLNDKRLDIGLAQSVFYGGVISGNISVTDLDSDAGQKIGVQLRALDFNLGQAIRKSDSPPDLGGTATMSVDLETNGGQLGRQIDNLSGTLSLLSVNGGAPDLGLGAASTAIAANAPLNGISRVGTSYYHRLQIGGTFDRGSLNFSDLIVASASYSASLHGSFGLKSREINLAGSLNAAEPGSPQAKVDIRGPVSAPTITMTPAAP